MFSPPPQKNTWKSDNLKTIYIQNLAGSLKMFLGCPLRYFFNFFFSVGGGGAMKKQF